MASSILHQPLAPNWQSQQLFGLPSSSQIHPLLPHIPPISTTKQSRFQYLMNHNQQSVLSVRSVGHPSKKIARKDTGMTPYTLSIANPTAPNLKHGIFNFLLSSSNLCYCVYCPLKMICCYGWKVAFQLQPTSCLYTLNFNDYEEIGDSPFKGYLL